MYINKLTVLHKTAKALLRTVMFLVFNNVCAQDVKIVDFMTLEKSFSATNDTTYIVHFFATWCSPCLKEIPNFIKLDKENKTTKKKVIFVSLDSVKDKHLLEKLALDQGFTSSIFLLETSTSYDWITKINKNWTGALPATLIVNKKRKFIEGPTDFNKFITRS